MAQTIDVKADMSQAINQINQFVSALTGQTAAAYNLATGLVKVNQTTGQLEQTINGVSATGQKFVAVLKGIPGNMEVVSVKVEETKTSLKSLGEQMGLVGEKGGLLGKSLSISFGGIVRILEAQIVKRALSNIIDQFTDGVKGAIDFTQSIARIQTVSQGANLSTQQWTDSIRGLSDKFGIPQADVATAAYAALQSQLVKGADATEFMSTALKLSQTVNITAADSVKLLTGVLNSYRLPATDAERISAIFFKTIQGGQVSANELADGFGRIGSAASSMGIKVEEISAAITTLTSKGIRFGEAAGLIQSLILQMTKPSEELSKLLATVGASSPEALIARDGFIGFLKLMDKAAAEGNTRLGELLRQFRAVRAVTNQTGEGFADYAKNLDKINTASADFDKASKTVKGALGREVLIELNKVKTFFTDEIGVNFLRGLVELGKGIAGDGGLVGSIKKLLEIIKVSILAFAAFKVAQLTVVASTAAWTAISGIASAAWGVYTGRITLATAATWRFNAAAAANILGLAALAGALLVLGPKAYNNITDQSLSVKDTETLAADAEAKRQETQANSESGKAQIKADATLVASARNAYSDRYKVILEYASRVFQIADSLKKRAVDNLKDIDDAVKVSGKTFTDSISNGIREFSRQISEARNLIKQSLKVSEDLPRQGGNAIFSEKLKFASGGEEGPQGLVINDQKAELIKRRIIELTTLAREEFKKGTKEGAEEARKLFSDAQKLETDLFTQQTEIRRKIGQDQIGRGTLPTDSAFQRAVGPDGKVRYEFTVQTAVIEEKINALTRERLQLEEQFRQAQDARKKALEEEQQKEKDRLRTITLLLNEATKFTVLDNQGKVKKEFKDDPAAAGRKFDEITEKIRASTKDEEFIKQFQLFSDLYRQRLAVVQQVETQISLEQAKAFQERAGQQAAAAQATVTRQQGELAAARATVQEQLKELAKFLDTIEKRGLSQARQFPGPDTALGQAKRINPLTAVDAFKEDASVTAAEPARQRGLIALQEALAAREAFNNNQTAASADNLKAKIIELKSAYESYIRIRSGLTQEQLGGATFPGDVGTRTNPAVTIGDRGKTGVDVAVKLAEAAAAGEAAQAALRQSAVTAQGLDVTIRGIPEAMRQLGPVSTESARVITNTLQQIGGDVNRLIDKYRELQLTIQGLNQSLPKERGERQAVEGQMMGGLVKYFNSGGFVPRGSDDVPAMLSKGEFVVNAQATREFLPQLRAMNSLQAPQYFSQGGQVTNVGDIHVSVTGGETSAATIQQIAAGLRREIKRGTVRLN